jgi:hypothetical protein
VHQQAAAGAERAAVGDSVIAHGLPAVERGGGDFQPAGDIRRVVHHDGEGDDFLQDHCLPERVVAVAAADVYSGEVVQVEGERGRGREFPVQVFPGAVGLVGGDAGFQSCAKQRAAQRTGGDLAVRHGVGRGRL